MTPTVVLVWTATVVFVLTAAITILGLVGLITLGGGDGTKHHSYLKWLFTILIVEVVATSLVVFASNVGADNRLIASLRKTANNADSLRSIIDSAKTIAVKEPAPPIRVRPRPSPPRPSPSDTTRPRPAVSDTTPPAPPRRETITRDFIVTADGKEDKFLEETIPIPEGWRYVSHRNEIPSKNGPVEWMAELVGNEVRVRIHVSGRSGPFGVGPRNWITLRVIIDIAEEKKPT